MEMEIFGKDKITFVFEDKYSEDLLPSRLIKDILEYNGNRVTFLEDFMGELYDETHTTYRTYGLYG